jgi:phosphoribosylglycinamide formyltransferase 1
VKNIAVLASGRGSNFSAIARAIKKRTLKANLALLICDNSKAPVLGRAKRFGVKAALVHGKDFASKKDFEAKIIQHLEGKGIDLIVLAGFMRLLSPEFVRRYKGRIVNIHPSLLPAFKGTKGILDAFEYGAKVTGVTVHFVDEELDHGPVILQAPVKIEDSDTLESIEAKIHKAEHALYPRAIQLVLEGKLKPEGRRLKVITR